MLQRLLDAKFEFVVIGGFAGVLHGSSYVTHDLDVCAVLNPRNLRQLRSILADLHPRHRMDIQQRSFLEFPPEGQSVNNLYLATDYGIIDLLSSIHGVGDFARVRQTAVELPLLGQHCLVLSLPDLIKGKEALGREKDLLMAKELRAIAAKQ